MSTNEKIVTEKQNFWTQIVEE